MEGQELLARAVAEMRKRKLSQRELARELGLAQGHLSKVIRGKVPVGPRVSIALERWLKRRPELLLPATLIEACELVASGSPQVMHLVTELMHIVAKIRLASGRPRRSRTK